MVVANVFGSGMDLGALFPCVKPGRRRSLFLRAANNSKTRQARRITAKFRRLAVVEEETTVMGAAPPQTVQSLK
jgi:hypothetical protein